MNVIELTKPMWLTRWLTNCKKWIVFIILLLIYFAGGGGGSVLRNVSDI